MKRSAKLSSSEIKIEDNMGKVYKDKKSKGCALCKPHKHGWAPKKKTKIIAVEKEMEREINKVNGSLNQKD
ncbi:MAG: hypothetical protein AABY79_09255 [Nitrospirota bacterium]